MNDAKNESKVVELSVKVAYGEIYIDIDFPTIDSLNFRSDSMDETLLWIAEKYPQYEVKIVVKSMR